MGAAHGGAWVALLLAFGGTLAGGLPARALPSQSEGEAEAPAAVLEVVDQTSVVAVPGAFVLQLRATGAPDDAVVRVAVYDRVVTRHEFGESVFGEFPRVLDPDAAVVPVADGTVDVTLLVVEDDDVDGLQLDDPGVYPLDVSLEDGTGAELARLITHLVRLPGPEDAVQPAGLAVIVPVHMPVSLTPEGSNEIDEDARAAAMRVVDAVNANVGMPLTLAPTPETLTALGANPSTENATLLDRLRDATDGRQVLSAPFVRVDVAELTASGLADELGAQLTAGDEALATALARRPDRRTWLADGALTDEALGELRQLGIDQVLIPESALDELDPELYDEPPSLPFEVENSIGSRQRAFALDDGMSARIASGANPALDAHEALAEVAVLALGEAVGPQGVAIRLPDDFGPADGGAGRLLAALSEHPLIESVTVDELFERLPDASRDNGDAGPLVRNLQPPPPPDLGPYPRDLTLTRLVLMGYRSLLGGDTPVVASLGRLLLVSAATGLEPSQRDAYVDAVDQSIATDTAGIQAPPGQAVRLTAREGAIPITLRNTTGHPVDVVVRLDSDKLEFPDGDTIHLTLTEETTRIDVNVRARTSGGFPLQVELTSPDGMLELSSTRYRVRSTAVSGVGLLLSIGAGLFLLGWWASHFRSTRRARRLVQ